MKKGKILVVDDNKGIRDALKILLGGYGRVFRTSPDTSVSGFSYEYGRVNDA